MKQIVRKGILLLLTVLLFLPAGSFAASDDVVVFGDADGDGELTAQDASCISRHLSRFQLMDAAALSRADYDGDGTVTEDDASLILSSFLYTDFQVSVTKSFSLLVTSDLMGNAWDPMATEEEHVCTAMNTAQCVMALRKAEPDLVLLDGGGSLLGSSIADDYPTRTERVFGPITTLFLNMGYDAVLLGDEAFSYPSQSLRREVNALIERKIPVLGANLQKSDPTIFDPKGVLWNEILPYVILEVPQDTKGKLPPARVAVIGMTDPTIAPSEDEIIPVDPLETYAKLRKELKDQVDYTILLYHGNAEVDASEKDAYPLRDMLKKTDSIDLVLCAHGGSYGVRAERNYHGAEIPIVTLPGGVENVTRINVSLRENGRPAISVGTVDTRSYEPEESIRRLIRPYVSSISGMMDALVCTVEERIQPYVPGTLGSTDMTDLIHEMQIWFAEQWIYEDDLDLPQSVVSIAYPYLTQGIKEGQLTFRDICRMDKETPEYALLLVRGSELCEWLSAYAKTAMQSDQAYTLYGLNYLLNTLNPDAPLGFLEHPSGFAVDDDEVFTLIVSYPKGEESPIRPYLDESWMTYEERLIADFETPKPRKLKTTGDDLLVDAMTAFFEANRKLKLVHASKGLVL